jgi:hypothetical protein
VALVAMAHGMNANQVCLQPGATSSRIRYLEVQYTRRLSSPLFAYTRSALPISATQRVVLLAQCVWGLTALVEKLKGRELQVSTRRPLLSLFKLVDPAPIQAKSTVHGL